MKHGCSSPCVAFIFARGGSKGVPRKNLRLLAGRPLVAHSIEAALACPSVDRVVVSTDDEEIASAARRHGALVPFMRPAELAQDKSPEWLAWRHAISAYEEICGETVGLFVSLPPTSPLRGMDDVEACIAAMRDESADVAITVTPAHRNPYFNMVSLDESGFARIMIAREQGIARRQDAPAAYDITTVAYAARPDFVRQASGIFAGRVKAVVVPIERSLDIDTPFDFRLAELLLADEANRQRHGSAA